MGVYPDLQGFDLFHQYVVPLCTEGLYDFRKEFKRGKGLIVMSLVCCVQRSISIALGGRGATPPRDLSSYKEVVHISGHGKLILIRPPEQVLR